MAARPGAWCVCVCGAGAGVPWWQEAARAARGSGCSSTDPHLLQVPARQRPALEALLAVRCKVLPQVPRHAVVSEARQQLVLQVAVDVAGPLPELEALALAGGDDVDGARPQVPVDVRDGCLRDAAGLERHPCTASPAAGERIAALARRGRHWIDAQIGDHAAGLPCDPPTRSRPVASPCSGVPQLPRWRRPSRISAAGSSKHKGLRRRPRCRRCALGCGLGCMLRLPSSVGGR